MPQRYYQTEMPDPLVVENEFRTMAREVGAPPRYEAVRGLLPRPFWEGHAAEIQAHDKAWELAFRHLRQPTDENGFVRPFIDTAFNDAIIMWDSVFMMFFGQYGRRAFDFMGTLDNFYHRQHEDGFICRELRFTDGSEAFHPHDPSGTGPNLFAWAEWRHFEATQDRTRLARVFPVLLSFHRWFRYNRSWQDGTYFSTGWGCGMDNLLRGERASEVERWFAHEFLSWVDTTCQQLFNNKLLLKMHSALGSALDVSDLEREQALLEPLVDDELYDEQLGFYVDRRRDGSRSQVMHVGGFWRLLAGDLPPERVERLCDALRSPRYFGRPHPVPALSAADPDYDPRGGYWRGGVWSPTTYMVLEGLSAADNGELSHELGLRHLSQVTRVFEETGTLWESYAPEGGRASQAKPDLVGWTGLSPISVLFEHVFGLRAGPLRGKLRWDVRLLEAHGVERYPFGPDGLVTLRSERRTSASERPKVTVVSSVPLELELRWATGRELLSVEASSLAATEPSVSLRSSGSAPGEAGGAEGTSEAHRDTEHRERMRQLKAEQDALVQSKEVDRGIILVNTGDGKGKSTAAFGLALRAAGSGLKVGLIQFIKGNWKTGEQEALKRFPEIEHVVSGEGFTWNVQDRQKDVAAAERGWKRAKQMFEASRGATPAYDLVILDELNIALSFDYLPLQEVLQVLRNKPESLNIAITGRDAKPELIELADTVTEMKSIKHAFDAGVRAQRGIEF